MNHQNAHHVVFTPKYRRPVFAGQTFLIERAHTHFGHICRLRNIDIIELSVQDDHIHLFIDIPKTIAVSKAVQDIKFYTSLMLRKEFEIVRMISPRALWQRKYFSRSIGGDATVVKKYIQQQGLS